MSNAPRQMHDFKKEYPEKREQNLYSEKKDEIWEKKNLRIK